MVIRLIMASEHNRYLKIKYDRARNNVSDYEVAAMVVVAGTDADASAGVSCRMTLPPHITNVTRSICDKSANGSASSAIISANKPVVMRPTRFSHPNNSAATLVADYYVVIIIYYHYYYYYKCDNGYIISVVIPE